MVHSKETFRIPRTVCSVLHIKTLWYACNVYIYMNSKGSFCSKNTIAINLNLLPFFFFLVCYITCHSSVNKLGLVTKNPCNHILTIKFNAYIDFKLNEI